MRFRFLGISVAALVLAVVVFGVMLAGMNGGRHMGAAVLAGVALQVIGALLVVVVVALTWWVSPGKRWRVAAGLAGVGLLVGAAYGMDRWSTHRRRAELDAISERYHASIERVASLDDPAFARMLQDPATWTPHDEHALAAVGEAWKRRACTTSTLVIDAVVGLPDRRWIGFFLAARTCGEARMDELVSRVLLRDEAFALPAGADERVDHAVMLLRVDPRGRLLERFIRSGFDINTPPTRTDPILFHFSDRAYADQVAVASLLRLGADPRPLNRDKRTVAEQMEYEGRNWFGEEWRGVNDAAALNACLSLVEKSTAHATPRAPHSGQAIPDGGPRAAATHQDSP